MITKLFAMITAIGLCQLVDLACQHGNAECIGPKIGQKPETDKGPARSLILRGLWS